MATPTYPSEAKIKELADQFGSYMLKSVKEGGKLMGGKEMMDFASASLPEGDTYPLTGGEVPTFVQALARGAKVGSNFFDVPLDPNIDTGPSSQCP